MTPRETVKIWPVKTIPSSGSRKEKLDGLIGGEEYRLVLENKNNGNGMPYGVARVAMYVGGERCPDLVTISGDDKLFEKKRRVRFMVPTQPPRCCGSRC